MALLPAPPSPRTRSMTEYHPALLETVATLPLSPGVYRFVGENERVLYVGKAKSLKKRVASYFHQREGLTPRIQVMLSLARTLEIAVTTTENEALILEANLIKRFRPPYNVLLKDDKSHPYLHLSHHPFPRLALLRHHPRKGAGGRTDPPAGRWFGPFPSVSALRETLKWLQSLFPLRDCEDGQFNQQQRPCLNYQIKLCSGPCCDRISVEHYGQLVRDVCLFLEGKSTTLLEQLQQAMWQAAEERAFEKAAQLRDRIRAITLIQDQRRVNLAENSHLDVISIAGNTLGCAVQLFCIRNGINWGNTSFFPENSNGLSLEEVLEAFVAQYYARRAGEIQTFPPEILVNRVLGQRQWLTAALSDLSGQKVRLHKPTQGEKVRLLNMATLNAEQALQRHQQSRATLEGLLQALGTLLGISTPLRRIEVYDVSHLHGSHPVGSQIVFGPDGWHKREYRHFNLADSALRDDTARMAQMLARRLARLSPPPAAPSPIRDPNNPDPTNPWPDLLLLDGGLGQLHAVLALLQNGPLTGIPVCAIAKGEHREAGQERLFLPQHPEPIVLPGHSPVLFLLQRIRDEAHRFAIGMHKAQRSRTQVRSRLDQIPGIGPQRKRLLLRHFGSVKALQEASMEELLKVTGVSIGLAEKIVQFFQEGS
ncbi:MAG: excinuclease ABC subunit UvrC [Magnetococcales bacterium]|nr:excinuclease ABC subunit UvrC [Magnetococcales bacterium]